MTLPYDPHTSGIVQLVEAQKQAMMTKDINVLRTMAQRWIQLENSMEARIADLAQEMTDIVAAGGTVGPGRLYEMQRYQVFAAQAKNQVAAYEAWSQGLIEGSITSFAQLGIQDAVSALRMGSSGVAGAFFDVLPVDAIDNMILSTGSGPLFKLLSNKAPAYIGAVQNALIEGTAKGLNPRQTAKLAAQAGRVPLNDMMTTARTEQIRAYREAARQQYAASGMVQKYIRLCAKNDRTCGACLALDGEVYDTDEFMAIHPNDRCTMVPWLTGMPKPTWETGSEWLAQQSPEVQQKILGKGAQELYASGAVDLEDFAVKYNHPDWGPGVRVPTLKELSGNPYHPDVSVSAPTAFQEFQPAVNPKVFDEADDVIAMNAWGEANLPWASSITDEEMTTAISAYQGDMYRQINKSLRSPSVHLSKMEQDLVDNYIPQLDAATSAIGHDVRVFRGAVSDSLAGLKVGEEFVDPGFVSTSLDRWIGIGAMDAPKAGGHVLFEIDLPGQVNGLYLGANGASGAAATEAELLLERNLRFRVAEDLGWQPGDYGDFRVIRLEVVGREPLE